MALKPANVQTASTKAWQQGVVTANDDPRVPNGGLKSAGNVILDQNGVVRPRPSLVLYGAQPLGTVLGEIYEFKDTTVIPNLSYRISMQLVSGVAQVYYSKDLGVWTLASGKTYSTTARAHFVQDDNKVLVMNGEPLSYFNIPTHTIIPFTALTTPTTPTLTTNTGLGTGTTPFTITYRVSANSTVGTTIASTALSITVNTDRDLWNASTQSLTIGWTAVSGAASYNVYVGVGGVGTEFQIATGITGTAYTDNGTAYQDTTTPYPLTDSTGGPKATRGDVINGQVYLVGITDAPYNVIVGGTYPHALDFTPANGGDTVPIGVGGKFLPVRVKLTVGTNGSSSLKVYCDGTNGLGKRYTMSPTSVTVANQTVNFFNVTEDSGEDGTSAPDAIVYHDNANYYPSVDGFKTDGVLPQLQTFLSTRRVSNTIQPDVASINREALSGAVGLAIDSRLYFALPVNAVSNTEIWVLDLQRGGAWMKPWNIAADWMMLYNSNTVANGGDGQSHFIILSNNQIFELTYASNTSDNGVPFSTNGSSGQQFFSPDQRVCAKLLYVIFTFLRPSGTITASVSGQFRNKSYTFTKSVTVNAQSTTVGWSELAWSYPHAWSQVVGTPMTMNTDSVDIKVKVNKELRWFDYSWNSTLANTSYELDSVVPEFVTTGIRDL